MSVSGSGGCCSSFWSCFCCPCCGCVCCCCNSTVDVLGKEGVAVDHESFLTSSPIATTDAIKELPPQAQTDNLSTPTRSRANSTGASLIPPGSVSMQRGGEDADRSKLMVPNGSLPADDPQPISPDREKKIKQSDGIESGANTPKTGGFPSQRPRGDSL